MSPTHLGEGRANPPTFGVQAKRSRWEAGLERGIPRDAVRIQAVAQAAAPWSQGLVQPDTRSPGAASHGAVTGRRCH